MNYEEVIKSCDRLNKSILIEGGKDNYEKADVNECFSNIKLFVHYFKLIGYVDYDMIYHDSTNEIELFAKFGDTDSKIMFDISWPTHFDWITFYKGNKISEIKDYNINNFIFIWNFSEEELKAIGVKV